MSKIKKELYYYKKAKSRYKLGKVKSARTSFVCLYSAELRKNKSIEELSQSEAMKKAHKIFNIFNKLDSKK